MVVVDTKIDLVVNTIKIEGQPSSVAFAPGGKLIYVADRLNNKVWVMDTETGTVWGLLRQASCLSMPGSCTCLTPINRLSVIDVKKGEDVRSMGIGILPSKMADDPVNRMLYVVSDDASISVVDTVKNERLKRILILFLSEKMSTVRR